MSTTEPQPDCLFCQIAAGAKGEIVWESDTLAAFADIHPQAPIHLLIVPKRHIANLDEADSSDQTLLADLLLAGAELARQKGIDQSGYRVCINTRAHAGQTVDHLHLHLIGGRELGPSS